MVSIEGSRVAGRSLVVDRTSLLAFLDRNDSRHEAAASGSASEMAGPETHDVLAELRKLHPPGLIPAPPTSPSQAMPHGVTLEPGNRLVLDYDSVDDLLSKIAGVLQAARQPASRRDDVTLFSELFSRQIFWPYTTQICEL